MTKRLTIPLLLLAALISLLPSCERERIGAIDYTYEALIEKAPTTKAFYYVNQPYQGKLSLDIDPRNESKVETAFLTEASGYALVGEDKKKIQPGETFIHDYRESPVPIEVYLSTIGQNVIRFDFLSERFSTTLTDTILVKDLHYTITADSLPEKMLVGKKFSFRLNIEEKEKTDNLETTASGTITKGAGIMYVAGDKILISKPTEIVTDLKDVLPENATKAGENVQTLTIGKNILTYLPQLDELNEINLKINNPYQSSQNFSMSFNIEKPVFGTEAVIDKKSIPYVRKDYSFLLKVFQVDVYEGNEYSLTYRFLKSTAELSINAKSLHQGETARIKEGENIVVLNSTIKENCDIEFTVSDKYGSQYKDTAEIGFQALPMYSVVVPETEGGTIVGAGSYEESSNATLKVTTNTGYTFAGFFTPENTLISSNPEYTFTVLEDVTIKAVFKKNIYKIDAIAGEGGSVTGGGSFEFASNVTLKAKANNGHSFSGWYEAEKAVSLDAIYSFQATDHRSLIGRFKLNKLTLTVDKTAAECATGEAVPFNLSIDEDGYTGTFKTYYQNLTGEGTFSGKESQVLAKGSHPMRYTPEREGTHTLSFRTVDDNGQEATCNVTITAAASELKANTNQSEITSKQGETSDLTLTIEEENHPKKFDLTYGLIEGSGKLTVNGTILGNTSTVSLAAGSHKIQYTPSMVGVSTLRFTIADARGQKKEITTRVTSKAEITATAGAHGSVTGSGSFLLNEAVKLQATPESGYQFTGWYENGANVSPNAGLTFPATASRNLQARFSTDAYRIIVIAGEGGTVTGSGTYEFGTQQTISATPSGGYSFDSWSDQGNLKTAQKARAATTDNAIKRVITITAESKTYIAAFKKNQYAITVKGGDGGTVTGSGTYDFGTEQRITATPEAGYRFVKWSDSNSEASRTIRVGANDATYIAEFSAEKYLIKVTAGEGGTATGTGTYAYATKQTITATANTGYHFTGWNDGNVEASRQITIEASDRTYTASFAVNQYDITAVSEDGNGTVTGGKPYDHNTIATLRATPKAGYNFSGWYEGGKKVSDDNPYSFTVAKERSITARFGISKHFITVTSGGNGTVTGSGTYEHGSQQTITAKANSGYSFGRWNDEGSGNREASRVILVDKEMTYVGLFSPNKYVITVNAGTGGTVTGSGSYDYGTLQTITATASTGYTFTRWSDGDRNAIRQVTVGSAPTTYTAEFTPNKYTITVTSGGNGTVTGGGTYDFATQHLITATPSPGYHFVRWDDGSTEASRMITVGAGNKGYTATFAINRYAITVNAGGGGTASGGGTYNHGESVSLTATPSNGYSFAGWSETGTNVSGSTNYVFAATAARNLTANFRKNEISASVNKPSQDVKVGQAASVSLSIAEDNYSGTFNVAYELISGSGTFSGNANQTVGAGTHTMSYTPSTSGTHTYRLTVSDAYNSTKVVNVTVMATLSPIVLQPNQTSFSLGLNGEATVSLAISEVAYSDKFTLRYDHSGASGTFKVNNLVLASGLTTSVSSGTATLKFQIGQVGDANIKVTVSDTRGQSEAVNIKVNATSTISVSAGTGGSASGGGTYNTLGATATVTASAATGYSFAGWYEGSAWVSGSASYTFTVSNSRALEARFTLNSYTLTVSASPSYGGSVSGGGTYAYGSQQTITASPAADYNFKDWSDGNTSASRVITIGAGNSSYTANFVPQPIIRFPVSCNINGSGSVLINGQPLVNGTLYEKGTYTLTAVPASGWSPSWTTRQITVVDQAVNESVTFTKNVTNITISLSNGYDSGRNYYYVRASSPVTTTITVKAIFRYYEENVCEGRIIYDYDKEITITLSPGQQSGNDWIDATGSDSCIAVSINHKSTSTPWNGQTISGATYTVSGGF